MSTENAGIMLEIIEGVHEGQFAIARHAKQHDAFKKIKRLCIELYHDRLCQQPVMTDGKRTISLVQQDYCKITGYVD